jgi:hypothetical protein
LKNAESRLDWKDRGILEEKKNIDKVREEWGRKLRRSQDKCTELEKKVRTLHEELDITKPDMNALRENPINSEVAKYVEAGKLMKSKYDVFKKEKKEMNSLIQVLRRNVKIEEDRINSAVVAAKATKDIEIAAIEARNTKLEMLLYEAQMEKSANEETIRELLEKQAVVECN